MPHESRRVLGVLKNVEHEQVVAGSLSQAIDGPDEEFRVPGSRKGPRRLNKAFGYIERHRMGASPAGEIPHEKAVGAAYLYIASRLDTAEIKPDLGERKIALARQGGK